MGSSFCSMCVGKRPVNQMRFDIREKRVSRRSPLFSRLRIPSVYRILSKLIDLPRLRNETLLLVPGRTMGASEGVTVALHDQRARICGFKAVSVPR